MRTLFLLILIYSFGCVPNIPNLTDAINEICEPSDEFLLRKNIDKTYILTGAKNDLSNTDISIFDIGLYCLGYQPIVVEPFVYLDDLKELIQQPVNLFYFSGHGSNVSAINASDYPFNANSFKIKYRAENLFFSSCKTLSDVSAIENEITNEVKYIMGYTNLAYDNKDNSIILDMLKEMKKGQPIPMAFFIANLKSDMLYDRWCIYKNSPEGLIEYSARSKNNFVE